MLGNFSFFPEDKISLQITGQEIWDCELVLEHLFDSRTRKWLFFFFFKEILDGFPKDT